MKRRLSYYSKEVSVKLNLNEANYEDFDVPCRVRGFGAG